VKWECGLKSIPTGSLQKYQEQCPQATWDEIRNDGKHFFGGMPLEDWHAAAAYFLLSLSRIDRQNVKL
jgi:hypothetical protein